MSDISQHIITPMYHVHDRFELGFQLLLEPQWVSSLLATLGNPAL
jgi:hypothetical protein